MQINQDEKWMQIALDCAKEAAAEGEVPVGAVLVQDDKLIAKGWNQPIEGHDPTAHAEVAVLRKAAQVLENYRLNNTTLYVTLEPCLMCAGAMVHARIGRLVFGAYDPKSGVAETKDQILERDYLNHKIEVQGGVLASECGQILKDFFSSRRK